jgi:hypothetical protein
VLESISTWLFAPTNSPQVGGVGLLLSVFGTILTLLGLYVTYRQAKKAKTTAQAAATAVAKFKFRADHYDAYRDLNHAAYAMETTRRHLDNDAWKDAVESYDDGLRRRPYAEQDCRRQIAKPSSRQVAALR